MLSPGCVNARVQKFSAGTMPGLNEIHSFSTSPVMSGFYPVCHRLIILIRPEGVTVNLMFQSFLQCFYNKTGGIEIHICNPHRYNILYTKCLHSAVKLNAVGALSFGRFIEIPHPIKWSGFRGLKII